MRTMGSVLALALALVACKFTKSSTSGDTPDATAGTADASDGSSDGSAGVDPTACVQWFAWPAQQQIYDASWGTALVDIAQHLPTMYGNQYWSSDAITAGHETTHGINAHLRNYEAPAPVGWNAFYVLRDRAAFVAEPHMRKADVALEVPTALQGDRYATYVTGQTAWDDTPLYLYDEFVAYTNGAEVGVGQVQQSLYTGQWTDAVMGPLEFVAYAIATAKATSVKDPTYYATNTQFLCFTAWNIQRAMNLFAEGRGMTQFTWQHQDDYAAALRTDPTAEPLRAFARQTWGATWTQAVIGF